jgi:hypothetical protein
VSENTLIALSAAVLALSLLVFLYALVTYWWRTLYASSTLITGIFWRLCRVAGWFGLAPRSWQTPYEYTHMLSKHVPRQTGTLWRLAELFVRDRWGSPYQPPHAQQDAERLWPDIRALLMSLAFKRRPDNKA